MKQAHAFWIFLVGLVGGVVWWLLRSRARARLAEAKRVAATEIAAARGARAERERLRKDFGELAEGVRRDLDRSVEAADARLKERLATAGERPLDDVEADYRRLLGLPAKD